MSIIIEVDSEDLELASELANRTYQRYKNQSGYYNNTVDSHLRGKVGEIAASKYFTSVDIEHSNLFIEIDRERDCDIVLLGSETVRIDVKTWNENHWQELGRCVSVNQFPYLLRKADVILWGISPNNIQPGVSIELHGWNSIEEIGRLTPTLTPTVPKYPGQRQVNNFQVPESQIHGMSELSTRL